MLGSRRVYAGRMLPSTAYNATSLAEGGPRAWPSAMTQKIRRAPRTLLSLTFFSKRVLLGYCLSWRTGHDGRQSLRCSAMSHASMVPSDHAVSLPCEANFNGSRTSIMGFIFSSSAQPVLKSLRARWSLICKQRRQYSKSTFTTSFRRSSGIAKK